jgi:hypothetical protein
VSPTSSASTTVAAGQQIEELEHEAEPRRRSFANAVSLSMCAARSSLSTSREDVESRLPVGSSPTTRSGWLASARARATRCCSPPDSRTGAASSLPPMPKSSSKRTAVRRASARRRPVRPTEEMARSLRSLDGVTESDQPVPPSRRGGRGREHHRTAPALGHLGSPARECTRSDRRDGFAFRRHRAREKLRRGARALRGRAAAPDGIGGRRHPAGGRDGDLAQSGPVPAVERRRRLGQPADARTAATGPGPVDLGAGPTTRGPGFGGRHSRLRAGRLPDQERLHTDVGGPARARAAGSRPCS